jgi:hypothetical protein
VGLEADHRGASEELAGSRSADVVKVAVDIRDVWDSTSSTAASRWATGHGKRVN